MFPFSPISRASHSDYRNTHLTENVNSVRLRLATMLVDARYPVTDNDGMGRAGATAIHHSIITFS
jgi:hypothetical protein